MCRIIYFTIILSVFTYANIKLSDMDLNREAVSLDENLSGTVSQLYPFAHYGFMWNDNDSNTIDWRPQGITAFSINDSNGTNKWIVVSWYHRKHHAYKGIRLSFVNVSNPANPKYRHVLLLDRHNRPFSGVHAGGLAYKNGKIFIPIGNGSDDNKYLYTFSIDNIQEIKPKNRTKTFNYRYVIQQDMQSPTNTKYKYGHNDVYKIPYNKYLKPSFLSYDWENKQFVTGSYGKCAKSIRLNSAPTKLYNQHLDNIECFYARDRHMFRLGFFYVDFNQQSLTNNYVNTFFSEMQGAAINKDNLWISSSHGMRHNSHLHVLPKKTDGKFSLDITYDSNNNNQTVTSKEYYNIKKQWCEIVFPPGLEDLHITKGDSNGNKQNLWLLTEFIEKSNSKGRIVFAIRTNKISHVKLLEGNFPHEKVDCHQ